MNRVTGKDYKWFFDVYFYVTIDPSSKILRQLDAVDEFQAWQARPRPR